MYNGYKSQVTTQQLEYQRDLIEEHNAREIIAKVLKLQPDCSIGDIRNKMRARIDLGLFVGKMAAEKADYNDWFDTQECARG